MGNSAFVGIAPPFTAQISLVSEGILLVIFVEAVIVLISNFRVVVVFLIITVGWSGVVETAALVV